MKGERTALYPSSAVILARRGKVRQMTEERDHFPPGIAEQLGWYVYRLIDPRNGETFYVGKGQGNRVFEHVGEALIEQDDEDATDLKLQRIKEIRASGLATTHVIHRHQIETEDVAYQIEAALIDAYPGLANKVAGHHSGDYGTRHVEQIISEYSMESFVAREPLILISIGQSFYDETASIYDAVPAAWRLDIDRACGHRLVLAHRQGTVVGAFRPNAWLPALKSHFPWLGEDIPERCGFEGEPADDVAALYVGKRVPDMHRTKGAANPVKYVPPDADYPA